MSRTQDLDEADHNTLGALRFVVIALEIRLIYICCGELGLQHDNVISQKDGGIPIGLLLMFLEFTDLCPLLNSLFWRYPVPLNI